MKDCSACARSRTNLRRGGSGRGLILAHPLKSLQRGRMRAGRAAREGSAPGAHERPGILQLPPSLLQRRPLCALFMITLRCPSFVFTGALYEDLSVECIIQAGL